MRLGGEPKRTAETRHVRGDLACDRAVAAGASASRAGAQAKRAGAHASLAGDWPVPPARRRSQHRSSDLHIHPAYGATTLVCRRPHSCISRHLFATLFWGTQPKIRPSTVLSRTLLGRCLGVQRTCCRQATLANT